MAAERRMDSELCSVFLPRRPGRKRVGFACFWFGRCREMIGGDDVVENKRGIGVLFKEVEEVVHRDGVCTMPTATT
jgi:hypothetical protein